MKLVGLLLLLCASFCTALCTAQDATVIELNYHEAAEAKQLYAAKVAADKAWDEAYERIRTKYSDLYQGLQFSKDFRFAVPKYEPTSGSGSWTLGSCCSGWSCNWSCASGCVTLTPASYSGSWVNNSVFTNATNTISPTALASPSGWSFTDWPATTNAGGIITNSISPK